MFGFQPKLPVSDQERVWVDDGFRRLEKMLGKKRMLDSELVLPDDDYFPDPYNKTPAGAERLFERVCCYMGVDRKVIELEIFPDETHELREILPYWSAKSGGCAGLYTHHEVAAASEGEGNDEPKKRVSGMVVALRSTHIQDPLTLVAVIAHELGHVILLGGGLLDAKTPDHEPLTDLLTVFLGFGVFTSNAAGRFSQFQDERRQGWSMQRLGYLNEQIYGYALARFARERSRAGIEDGQDWVTYLSTNVRTYYKRSLAFLNKNHDESVTAKPIN